MSVGVNEFRLSYKGFLVIGEKIVSAQGHGKTGVVRTVNPLAYAFVGSSPTSPTIPGEAEVGFGKTLDLVNDV
jgi:hypothetical protein